MDELAIELPYRFEPWPHQAAMFRAFARGTRRFCEVIHRRGGKDKAALNLMIDQMTRRVGNYCHVFPQRQRARLIIWEGIDSDGMRYTDHFPPELVFRKLEQEMMVSLQHPEDVTKEGSIYRCMGSDKDTHLLVGTNPIGVIWSEYPEINPRMRELVLPILRRNAGWEILVYTPRGRNHGYRLYQQVKEDPEWHTSYLTINDTRDNGGRPLVTAEDVAADIRAGMAPETAQQEYYLSWDIPMPGAVYSAEMQAVDREGRIQEFPVQAHVPVLTAWDIGPAHTAIWFFQQWGGKVYFLDYEEGPGSLPAWIARCKAKPYQYDHSAFPEGIRTMRQPYAQHFGPWDLEQDDYATGKSRYGIALEHGWRFTIVPKGAVEDGIETARQLLAVSVFHPRTEQGIDALRSYRYEWDETRLVYQKRPYHDWASHGADAFRYAAVGLFPPRPVAKAAPSPNSIEWWRRQVKRARQGKPVQSYVIE